MEFEIQEQRRRLLYDNEKLINSQFNSSCSKHVFQSPMLKDIRESSLILSIILGYHHQIYLRYLWGKQEQYKDTADKFVQLRILSKKPTAKLALRQLNRLCLNVITDLDLNYSGPYALKSTVRMLSNYDNCAINVF